MKNKLITPKHLLLLIRTDQAHFEGLEIPGDAALSRSIFSGRDQLRSIRERLVDLSMIEYSLGKMRVTSRGMAYLIKQRQAPYRLKTNEALEDSYQISPDLKAHLQRAKFCASDEGNKPLFNALTNLLS